MLRPPSISAGDRGARGLRKRNRPAGVMAVQPQRSRGQARPIFDFSSLTLPRDNNYARQLFRSSINPRDSDPQFRSDSQLSATWAARQ